MFSSGPKYQKLTTNLRLTINRLKLLEKKKTEQAVKARREIADFLSISKIDRAKIRVEHIVREDYLVEAMELVEMYCDLLLARMGLIQSTKELDPGLEEPIASILWATPRLQADCQELKVVSDQLTAKFGKEFTASCQANTLGNVNEKLTHKLSVQAPPKMLVEKYLEEIARTYNVPYTPDCSGGGPEDILSAEGLLIDFNNDKRFNGPGGSGGSGGGGGGGMRQEHALPNPNQEFAYPPPKDTGGPAGYPPPNHAPPFTMPELPPSYDAYPPPQPSGGATGGGPPRGGGGGVGYPKPSHPVAPQALPKFPDLPNLPAVPADSLPPGGASAGGEDVDFDDLTKRFEELKKRK